MVRATAQTWSGASCLCSLDYSPGAFETALRYWEMLHDLIDTEPPYDAYRHEYGNLAALGIDKGQPFVPDERMTRILWEGSADRQRADASPVVGRPTP
jgi:hypothetical protein